MQDPTHLDTKTCPKCGSMAVSTGAMPLPDSSTSSGVQPGEHATAGQYAFTWSCVSCDYRESIMA